MTTPRHVQPGSVRETARWFWPILIALPCLCAALLMADQRPAPPKAAPAGKKAAPAAKKADATPAATKKAPEKKDKKADLPAGYEDAPQAGDVPRGRPAAAAVRKAVAAREKVAVEQVLAINVDANVANMEKQFLPQFQPLLTAELSFINRACGLDLQQRLKIHAVSDDCLKAAVRKYAIAQNAMRRGGIARMQATAQDPTVLVHLALAAVLEKSLRPEQQSVYRDELAKRQAYRKQVAIDNLVAMIDGRLILTSEQRETLKESLSQNWQDGWVQTAEILLNNSQYLPAIPDQYVLPALNETQRKVWRGIQKQSFTNWGGFAWGQQVGAVEDFPLAEAGAAVEEQR